MDDYLYGFAFFTLDCLKSINHIECDSVFPTSSTKIITDDSDNDVEQRRKQ